LIYLKIKGTRHGACLFVCKSCGGEIICEKETAATVYHSENYSTTGAFIKTFNCMLSVFFIEADSILNFKIDVP
jgi:hypothetical protein